MKKVVITGTGSGIGYYTAKRLCESGYIVYGNVLTEQEAKKVKSELGEKFRPLIFDVTNSNAIAQAVKKVENELEQGEFLNGLVNNAGIFLGGPITETSLELFRKQFDVNFFGVVDVTKSFLPLLGAKKGAKKPGKIINISSMSAQFYVPFCSHYSCSKFAVEAFSTSLRRELLMYGIDVVVIAPAMIKTPIWDKQEESGVLEKFNHTDYRQSSAAFVKQFTGSKKNASDVSLITKKIQYILEARKTKHHYNVCGMYVRLTDNIISRTLPPRILDKIMGKKLKLLPEYL